MPGFADTPFFGPPKKKRQLGTQAQGVQGELAVAEETFTVRLGVKTGCRENASLRQPRFR